MLTRACWQRLQVPHCQKCPMRRLHRSQKAHLKVSNFQTRNSLPKIADAHANAYKHFSDCPTICQPRGYRAPLKKYLPIFDCPLVGVCLSTSEVLWFVCSVWLSFKSGFQPWLCGNRDWLQNSETLMRLSTLKYHRHADF